MAAGAEALPREDLQDWVTYGDYLVPAQVTSEEHLDPSEEETGRGEGVIHREVTLTFDTPEWTRPTLEGHKYPAELLVVNGGWLFHGEEEQPWRVEGQVFLEKGEEYLVLLSFADMMRATGEEPGESEWIVLDAVPEEGTAVISVEEQLLTPARKALIGQSAESSGTLLTETAIDPAAAKYMTLEPVERYQRVQRDEG